MQSLDLGGVAGELLAERERRGVLEVRAADLDDVVQGRGLVRQRGVQSLERRDQLAARPPPAAMCIAVGKLSLDDWPMFTWSLGWTGVLPPRLPPSSSLARFGDHLVGVHVRLGAGPGLPDDERELVVELAAATSAAACWIASASCGSSPPIRALTRAAACLTKPSAWTISAGIRSRGPNGKFSIERSVCAPQ